MKVEILKSSETFNHLLPIVASEQYLRARSNFEYGWFKSKKMILPFILEKKAFFKRVVFTHGVIFLGATSLEEEKEFLNNVIKICSDLGVDFICQPHTSALFRTFPNNSICCEFGSYQVDLSLDENRLFKNVHQKHRNVIRKAIRDGVQIVVGKELLETCANLIKMTKVRQKLTYMSKEQLKKISEELGDNVLFYVAMSNGVAQGCAVIVWNEGHTSYYLCGGSVDRPAVGAINYLHWKAMLDMKTKGVKKYDFMGARILPIPGSKQETMQRFKARFGGTMVRGYLWKYIINKLSYKLFKFTALTVNQVRGKKYVGDIIDAETTCYV